MSDRRTRPELLLGSVELGQCPYCEGTLGNPSTNDYRPCLGCRRQWKIDVVHGRRLAVSISPPGMLREFASGRLPSPFCSRRSAWAVAPTRRSRLVITECESTNIPAAR